jgi:hypothetical protein
MPLIYFVVIDNFDNIRLVATCIAVNESSEDHDWMFLTIIQETGAYFRYVVTDEDLKMNGRF